MKTLIKSTFYLILFSTVLLTSCRKEEIQSIQVPIDDTLNGNSSVASLMQRTAKNDGSNDNIIDYANCFNIQLPVTVFANGIELTVASESDLYDVELIFDEFDDDSDALEIVFPITIILEDFTQVSITSITELNSYASTCNGENVSDDDIECIDFQYPITASIFNTNNELISTVTLNNDQDLYNFIDDIDVNDIISINFPITVVLSDGTQISISSLAELETTIENAENDCDEDDDFDYNDDDCNSCTTTQLTDILTSCSDWTVDKLERDNSSNDEDYYTGYVFNFMANGTVTADFGAMNYSGTWSASGSGNNISVTISIPALAECNNIWTLHEIEVNTNETKVDLRLGNERLRYESNCTTNSINDTALVQALTNGDWFVTYFFDDIDETTDFNDFTFNFASNGTGTATDTGGTTNGTWSTSIGDETDLELNLNFGASIPLYELSEDWDVLEVTNDIIRLKDISGNDGSTDFLTLERSLGGGGGDDIATVLSDGLWFVAGYFEDADDQTADYNGYTLDFDAIAGTVVADNGTAIYGTWQVLSGGNVVALNFGASFPFAELNDDDWDVISVTSTQVIIRDVSGGGGGIDTLTLEKI